MSRMMAFVAALMLVPVAAANLRAQGPPDEDDPFVDEPHRQVTTEAAEDQFQGKPVRNAGSKVVVDEAEQARTLFQAAKAKGLVPQVLTKVDFEQVLRQPTKFSFDNAPLVDAIDYLSKQHNLEIQLDQKGLTDAAVDPSAPVTRSIHNWVSLEAGLHLLLDEFDLTFAVENETIKITSQEKAHRILTNVVYAVPDLVTRPRGFGPLMNIITSTIQPDTWDDNGGPGSVQPFAKGRQLIVSQTRAVHAEIRELLAAMRAELPKAKLPEDEPAKMTTSVYHLWGTAGDQTAEALQRVVAPSSWQGDGGEGIVCVVGQSKNAAAMPGWDLLLVRQTEEVHAQIDELLADFHRNGLGGKGGGMSGMMGGSGNAQPSK